MREIMPGVYTFSGLLVGRVYAIRDADGLTLIDAGMAPAAERILRQLAAAGFRPGDVRRILITHAHFDHIGGLPRLQAATGAQVIASAVEAPIVAGEALQVYPPLSDLPFPDRLLRLGQAEARRLPGTPVDRAVADGEVLTDIMAGLQVVLTPGHTPGHAAFWQPDRRVLFCGDALMRMGGRLSLPIRAFTTDKAATRQSIARLAALQPEVVCFGHGAPLVQDAARALAAFAGKSS